MARFAALALVTPRLTLRRPTAADLPALYAIFSHLEVMRYWSSPPWTDLAQAEHWLLDAQHDGDTGQALRLVLERRADQAVLGTCALHSLHAASRRAELGYALGRPYWGAGYMHEALQALVTYAFETLDLHRLEADIDPRNQASAKALARLGFQLEGHLRERWIVAGEISDTGWYGLLAREWPARTSGE